MEKEEKKPKVNLVISCQTLDLDEKAVVDNFAIEVFPADPTDKDVEVKLKKFVNNWKDLEGLKLNGRLRIDEQLMTMGRTVAQDTIRYRKSIHMPKESEELSFDCLVVLSEFLELLDKKFEVSVWGKKATWHAKVLTSLINDAIAITNDDDDEQKDFVWPFPRKNTYHAGALKYFADTFGEGLYGVDVNERDDAAAIVSRYREWLECLAMGMKCMV